MCRVAAPHLTSSAAAAVRRWTPSCFSSDDASGQYGYSRIWSTAARSTEICRYHIAWHQRRYSLLQLQIHIHAAHTHTYIHIYIIYTYIPESCGLPYIQAALPVIEQSCVLPSRCFANERYASFLSAFLSHWPDLTWPILLHLDESNQHI